MSCAPGGAEQEAAEAETAEAGSESDDSDGYGAASCLDHMCASVLAALWPVCS